MPDDSNTDPAADALARVDRFIAQQGSLTRHGVEQPGQGSTNRVVIARRGNDLIVFKVFRELERKERECFGLRHWHASGLVPDLIWDVDANTIAMSHIPGMWLHEVRRLEGDASWRRACTEAGRAVGLLTRVPLSDSDRLGFESRFYQGLETLEMYVGRILALGRGVCARDPDFRDAFWQRNLDFIEAQMGHIFSQPRILYHQDVANFHVKDGRFTGFFDLEMCRVGCAAMQLGAALGMLQRRDIDAWPFFREGWESGTGAALKNTDLRCALAAHYLLGWREISRYLSYDGTPGTGFSWAEPADPVYYRRSFEAVEPLLRDGLKR